MGICVLRVHTMGCTDTCMPYAPLLDDFMLPACKVCFKVVMLKHISCYNLTHPFTDCLPAACRIPPGSALGGLLRLLAPSCIGIFRCSCCLASTEPPVGGSSPLLAPQEGSFCQAAQQGLDPLFLLHTWQTFECGETHT